MSEAVAAITFRGVWLVHEHETKESMTIQVCPGAVALPPDKQGGEEIEPLVTFGVVHGQPLAELQSMYVSGLLLTPMTIYTVQITCIIPPNRTRVTNAAICAVDA